MEYNNFYNEDLTERTGSGLTQFIWYDIDTNCNIAGTSLSSSTKYLIIAKAVMFSSNDRTVVGCRISTTDDSTIATKSEFQVEPMAENSPNGAGFFFAWSFTTGSGTPADVKWQWTTGSTTWQPSIEQRSILLIDLDDLGSNKYVEASDAGGTGLGTTAWGNVMASIPYTSLAGSTEYLVLGYSQMDVDDNKTEYFIRLAGNNDGGSSQDQLDYYAREGENTSIELNAVAHFGRVLTQATPATGVDDIEIQAYSEATGDYTEGYSYLIALDVSAFEDFEYSFNTAADQIGTSQTTMTTISGYSPQTANANHLIVGRTGPASNAVKVAITATINGTEVMVGDIDEYVTNIWDPDDRGAAWMMARESIASSPGDIDLDAIAVTTSSIANHYSFIGVLSLEKPSVGKYGGQSYGDVIAAPIRNRDRRAV